LEHAWEICLRYLGISWSSDQRGSILLINFGGNLRKNDAQAMRVSTAQQHCHVFPKNLKPWWDSNLDHPLLKTTAPRNYPEANPLITAIRTATTLLLYLGSSLVCYKVKKLIKTLGYWLC
jgi:hypothetical protein